MSTPRPILTRHQRFCRYCLRLVVSLLLLCIGLNFPVPTAELARRATERRSYFGPSEVLCTLEKPLIYNRSYAVRWEDWYGVVSIRKAGLFWDAGQVDAVKNDPDQPLIPLESHFFLARNKPIIVFSNTPSIASVTLEFLVRSEDGALEIITVTQQEGENGCFLLTLSPSQIDSRTYSRCFCLSGYDADGKLVWRSPTPTGGSEGWDVIFGPDALDL